MPMTTLALVLAGLALPGSAEIIGLGDLSGGTDFSRADGVSDDGSVVVGRSRSGNRSFDGDSVEAFRWTMATGMVGLGDLEGSGFESFALAVSGDGGVAVGQGHTGVSRATRWIGTGAPEQLPEPKGGGIGGAEAVAINDSGTVVIGSDSGPNGREAMRWTGLAVTGLGDLPGGDFESRAFGVSDDGSIIVGYGTTEAGHEAFRLESGVMVPLGELPGGTSMSRARGCSGDGSVIVGESSGTAGIRAVRWTVSGDGPIELGDLPGQTGTSAALAVSGDGRVIVGYATTAEGTEAFVWTPGAGTRRLVDVLAEGGADVKGWTPIRATAVSGDGRFVVGYGASPDGFTQAFRARLPESCDADFDGSGDVGFDDLLQLLGTWGACPGCSTDLDGDDEVGFSDLVLLLAAWGACG